MKLSEIKTAKHMTIAEMMYQNARKYPDKEAVVFGNSRLTYKYIDRESNRAANCIIELGVKKGDRISMMVNNSDLFVIIYFGIIKAGGVAIPVNTRFTSREVGFILKNSESKLFIYDEQPDLLLEDIDNTINIRSICTEKCSDSHEPDFKILVSNFTAERPNVNIDENDLCCIIYTSGTTGTPRGAVFTHRKVVYNAGIIGALNHRFNLYTRSLIMMPMFHSAPLNNHVLGTIFVGGTLIIVPKCEAGLFLEMVQKEKVTHFFGPSLVYLSCIKSFDVEKYDISSVQLFIMGGSPASQGDMERIVEVFRLKDRFMQVYGLTEGGPSGCALVPEDIEGKSPSIGLGGCIGSELKIVDSEQNVITQPDVVGELAVYSECNMLEYHNDTVKTGETMVNGWILTGDLAMYDNDGYIYFVDRKKDIIICGGQNVYSKEVEDVIMEHPAVHEAVVMGVLHPEWGESVKAVVSLLPDTKATPGEIKSFCADKLAKFKRPRYVQIVSEIPHNPAGKILKQIAKNLYGKPEDCPSSDREAIK